MKCKSIEKKLLAQSGELSWIGRQKLVRHLRGCAHCRRFDEDLNHVTAALRTPGVVPNIGSEVLERLRVAARKQTSRRELIHIRSGHGEPLSVTLMPAMIYSALCILLLTGFWLVIRLALHPPQIAQTKPALWVGGDWEMANIDTQIAELSDRLDVAATVEDLLPSENEDIDSIARELLKLEGQQI